MSEAAHGEPGHNVGGISEDRLRSLVDRHENLDAEIKALRSDQRDIMKEAQSAGFDVGALRQVIRFRKMDADKLRALDDMVDLYRKVLGV